MNKREERETILKLTKEVDEEKALLYLYNCSKQGQFCSGMWSWIWMSYGKSSYML